MTILRNNDRIEELRDEVLKREDEGLEARFDYQTCQPVFVPRGSLPSNTLPTVASSERQRLIAWCEECKRLLREQEAQEGGSP